MVKITLYLPDELKAASSRVAVERVTSEAEIIGEALREKVDRERPLSESIHE